MARKGAPVDSFALSSPSPEKRRSSKAKKEKSRVQSAWIETVSKTREKYPLPSMHLRISFTDMSRPWLGKWSQARRGGNDNNIPVVRTKSQAGMLRPARFPTIYRSNARLFIDPFEEPLPTRSRATASGTDSEKHSVIADSPEPVAVHIESFSREKESVIVDAHDGFEIKLSPRIENVEQMPSRFEELSDDASVHELEAVYATESWSFEDRRHSDGVVLCEANDPTAFTTLEILQRSFTIYTDRQPRPQISLSIPRSQSLHFLPESGTTDSAIAITPPSPASAALYRSLTQLPSVPCSLISPLTPINMPQPMRPYSSISVPLFMEASELAQLMEEVPSLPATDEVAAERLQSLGTSRPPTEYQDDCEPETGSYARTIYEQEDVASRSSFFCLEEWHEDDGDGGEAAADVDDAEDEDEDEDDHEIPTTDAGPSRTQKPVAESINKPLPPEPYTSFPTMLPPLGTRPRLVRMAQSQEILPQSRYSPTKADACDKLKRRATVKPPSLDQAFQELEWRLSSIRRQLTVANGPCSPTSEDFVGKSLSQPPSTSSLSISQPTNGGRLPPRRRQLVGRCVSASYAMRRRRRVPQERRPRSCEDAQSSTAGLGKGEPGIGEEAETWYRTASERSSADLSHSVFSDAGTDGTCQTEQSQWLEKVKELKEGEPVEMKTVIKEAELPQALQAPNVGGDVPERIVLQIMSHSATLKDLFTFAGLSKSFYHAYKQHELHLIKTVVHRSSRPAWELRETSEASPVTPRSYLRLYSVELYTTGMLKSLILVQCESFLRHSTIAGLIGTDEDESAAIDAAFWRVWTFCRLFGRKAGQDEDIEAQIDWLNGGPLARARDPGTSFGVGNGDGLSKEEVYDMMEISTCLSVLMQTFHGRADEACAAGIYECCNAKTRRDRELVLEEWTSYILTLGPSCILALAPSSFTAASELGLTKWTPPNEGSSRSKFFKEPLTRVYRSRLAAEPRTTGTRTKRSSKASQHRMTKSELAQEIDRARQLAFAHEIRFQRQHSPGKSEPLTFSDERPMSVYSQIVKAMTYGQCRISAQDLATMPKPPSHLAASRTASTMSGYTTPRRPPTPPVFTSASAVPSADDDFPINVAEDDDEGPLSPVITVEEVEPEYGRLVDPTDRALSHLVNVLGFGGDEAKWALTRSENGHGINMEKAISLLVDGNPARDTPTSSRTSSRQEDSQHPQHHRQYPKQYSPPPGPVEVESSTARPSYIRQRSPIPNSKSPRRDSTETSYDEMTPVEKERANKMRMREKSYRVLGIAQSPSPSGAKKRAAAVAKRFSRR